jgi:hypothetical protein
LDCTGQSHKTTPFPEQKKNLAELSCSLIKKRKDACMYIYIYVMILVTHVCFFHA